jgi:hypothetical protein
LAAPYAYSCYFLLASLLEDEDPAAGVSVEVSAGDSEAVVFCTKDYCGC